MSYHYSFTVRRKNVWQLFILYSCSLFYVVFLTPNRYRGNEGVQYNLKPLVTTIQRFSEQGNQHFWAYYIGYWGNIFGNVILFMPFGLLSKCLYPEKRSQSIALYGLIVSACIEFIQLLLQIGVCDIDDVILNVAGTLLGVSVYRLLKNRIVHR